MIVNEFQENFRLNERQKLVLTDYIEKRYPSAVLVIDEADEYVQDGWVIYEGRLLFGEDNTWPISFWFVVKDLDGFLSVSEG